MLRVVEWFTYVVGLCLLSAFVFSPTFDFLTGSPRMCFFKGEHFQVTKGYKCPAFTNKE